ncbi:MAG: glycosyltransferase family 1 protein [Clostridia bacterium]
MIRVLQVVNRMGYGGIETFLMNIYRNIDRSKIQFDFAVHTEEKGEYDDEIKKMGGNIYYFNSRRNGLIEYYKDWNKFLKENASKYVAIHMHASSLTTVLPIKLAKKHKIKNRIIHAHSTLQSGKIHNVLNKIHQINIKKYATDLFACSTEAGIYVFGKNPFCLVHNGIDVLRYSFNQNIRQQVRNELEIKENEVAIVHIGRFVPEKNHKFLIDIFDKIDNINFRCKLFLIGDGVLKNDIEQKVNEKNLQNKIKFLGRRNDVNRILQGMDLCIFPSIFEGLPVTMIEMQAAGLPIFASNNISSETKISDLVEFISLLKSDEEWAKLVLENMNFQRKNMSEIIEKAGYDIKSTINMILNIYLRS